MLSRLVIFISFITLIVFLQQCVLANDSTDNYLVRRKAKHKHKNKNLHHHKTTKKVRSTSKTSSTSPSTSTSTSLDGITAQMETDLDRLDWIAPEFLIAIASSSSALQASQSSISFIESVAKLYKLRGPWSVTQKKSSYSPSGDPKDYVSFAPYWWPTSQGITNPPSYCSNPSSASDPTLVWKNCAYEQRDGQRNPDVDLVTDAASFRNTSRSALMNAVSFALSKDSTYADTAAQHIQNFYLNSATAVNPSLNYGQIVRGKPRSGSSNDWSKGTFRGLIEWRSLVKIANAVTILRSCGSSSWTSTNDSQLKTWAQNYIQWFDNNSLSIQAKNNGNNFSSFWYAQSIALRLIIQDYSKASSLAQEYFNGVFKNLISSNGDQPQESSRTRPVHYRAFGVEPMIVNARMAYWLGTNLWASKASSGAGINDAVAYALSQRSQASSAELAELAPHIAVALNIYGDFSDKRYANFLADPSATGDSKNQATWRLFDIQNAFQAKKK